MRQTPTPTDADLIRAARRDADAFAELYDRYGRHAVVWARRGGVAEPDVIDVAAELFAEAWRSRRRFRDPGDGSAAAWLYGIERHLIARYHRRRRVDDAARRRLGMDVHYGDEAGEDVVEQLGLLDGGDELAIAIADLPPAQATAVRLRVVDELPYEEIASRLSCTPVTARKHVSLALRTLRSTFDPETP